MKNKELGNKGEKIAKKFLIDKGFAFITENYFTRKGEIDLVFIEKNKEKHILVIVEVKTRKNKKHLDLALGFQKAKNLEASVGIFLEKEEISFDEMRYDVVFVAMDSEKNVAEIGYRPNFL